MFEFFEGWRRRIGCGLLVMACVLTGGWVRSQVVFDWIIVQLGTRHLIHIQSNKSSLCFCWEHDSVWHLGRQYLPNWGTLDSSRDWIEPWGARWKLRFGPFRALITTTDQIEIAGLRVIGSYWSFIIPLTLLSACLILWKPRRRPGQSISCPNSLISAA